MASAIAKVSFRRISLELVITYVYLIALGIITLAPIAYMVSQAFTPEADQNQWPVRWLPEHPTVNNFQRLLADPTLPVLRWLFNSFFVSTSVMLLTLLLCSLAAYAFARLEFPGRDVIFFIILISLMIPGAVTFIPVFLLMRDLKFLDTYNALIWPAGANAFGVFMLRQYFITIPKELEEAALVDGANRFRIYWQIALPLVSPALVALGIFTFLGSWNDLFWPLVVLSERTMYTLPVGLAFLGQGNYVQQGLTMAAATLASAPVLIVYAIFQRRIVQGIALTGGLGGR
ncbi:binding-protein-dependent transport systems inner membrane component [Thermobaculum terrenum ATCC BAA-798]|uniref:Binding-protein-dependent transport systems inner membrane component n=1 Tax=Thermobaculum terrenum (strain ATCC BAA-798 / CCMEE 7001 / YNP1) TaxID=525904 RepID=D1CEJ4_THET1|nr:carbohydrate ABC transporter permease [Thermobaculum terrenum]ACZ41350.1 binding-protein-dependent transport systems inner membrane component [Thermobaculum terrenum ATCC BAA-798]